MQEEKFNTRGNTRHVLAVIGILLVLISAVYVSTNRVNSEDGESEGVPTSVVSSGAGLTDSPERIEEVAASVLRLEIYDDENEEIATGSGFIAFDQRTLVTSRHLMVNMDHIIAYAENGKTYEFKEMYSSKEEDDIALCRAEKDTDLPILPVRTDPPSRGTKIITIASPLGFTNLVTDGVISGIWQTEETERILFTASVSQGSSGGAVLDDDGRVIGVVSGTYSKGQNLNFAVSIEKAQKIYTSMD